MPRKRGIKQSFNFVKGWNTEASPMTFPDNTAKDLDNVVLDIDGSIRRRMGVVCESATSTRYVQRAKAQYTTPAIGFFKWENVAGSGNFNILVSQFGTLFQFNKEDGTDLGTLDFSDIAINLNEAKKAVVEVASGLGYLFVTGPHTEPFYLTYDVTTGAITKTSFEIQIRDFEGVDDGLDVDERPSTLSNLHEYNLRNAGWPSSFLNIYNGGSKTESDPVQFTYDKKGVYPSNADVIYYGKTGSGTDEDELGRYDPNTMFKNVFGTTPAPKGKYIFNAFDVNRSSIVAGATDLTVNNRPRAVAFHNGRAFYAGVNAVDYTGKVYYSQQLNDIKKVGHCYQENDPTAEEFNQLLATDGGEITIPNCGNILRIAEGPAGIIVFASNGMWEITGTEGKFSATDFFVRKVTDIGCIGGETVVNADGNFFYFSDAGIVGTQRDQVTGNLSAEVVTTTNIQLGYLLFGGPQRRGARGVWIRGEKKCVWLYSTDPNYDGVNNRFKYNGVLILDATLGAFYKYSISDFNIGEAPYVSGIVESASSVSIATQEKVTASGADVTASGQDVTVEVDGVDADTITSTWKLQVVRPTVAGATDAWGIDFATLASRSFTDWYFEDEVGANYDSYLETGYDYGGEAMFEKRPTYVYTYMSRVSKSNATGGYYNIPDPTDTVVVEAGCDVFLSAVASTTTVTYESDKGETAKALKFYNNGLNVLIPDAEINQTVFYYSMPTAYDIQNLTLTDSINIGSGFGASGGGNDANWWAWNSTGTRVIALDNAGQYPKEYTLTVPYDLSTVTYVGDWQYDVSYNGIRDLQFNPDGTRAWVTREATGVGQILEMPVAGNFSMTGSPALENPSIEFASFDIFAATGGARPQWLRWRSDGTAYYVTDSANNRIYRFDCSTPWDITTSTVNNYIDATTNYPAGMELVESESQPDKLIYIDDFYSNINSVSFDCDLCGTPGVDLIPDQAYSDTHGVNYLSVVWKPDGTKFWGSVDGAQTMYENNLSTAWDLTTATTGTTANTVGQQNRQPVFTNGGTRYITFNPGSSTKVMYSCGAYDLSSGLSALGSRNISGFLINCAARDGSYLAAISGGAITMYSTGGDWDDGANNPSAVSSWDFDTALITAGLTMGASQREDGGFSNDGTQVYIACAAYDSSTKIDILVGTMSTPWNLDTTTIEGIWTIYDSTAGLTEIKGEVRVVEDLAAPLSEFLIATKSGKDMVKYVSEC